MGSLNNTHNRIPFVQKWGFYAKERGPLCGELQGRGIPSMNEYRNPETKHDNLNKRC
jgi:hypothetical protein